jgi:putative endonuclease
MHYVYIIESLNYPNKIYIGQTSDLKRRLADHNCGNNSHTAKYMPWKIEVYLGFDNKQIAIEFEKYLKSGSGRAMIAKRFFK